jgi:hypothetical protein
MGRKFEVSMAAWLVADEQYPAFKKGDNAKIILEMFIDGRLTRNKKKETYFRKIGTAKYKFSMRLLDIKENLFFSAGKYNFYADTSLYHSEGYLKPKYSRGLKRGAYYTGICFLQMDGTEQYVKEDKVEGPKLLYDFKVEKIMISGADSEELELNEEMSVSFRSPFDFPNLKEVEQAAADTSLNSYILVFREINEKE